MKRTLVLLALFGCSEAIDKNEEEGTPTDDALTGDDGADESEAPDMEPPDLAEGDDGTRPEDVDVAEVWHHVISGAEVAPPGTGYDLDGDGADDNALGALAILVNPMIEQGLPMSETVGVIQLWGLGDGDRMVEVGVLAAEDTDDDTSDNFDGAETFMAMEDTVLPSGQARVFTEVELDNGRYTTELPAGSYNLAGLDIETATPVMLAGNVSENAHAATIAFGVSTDGFIDMLDGAIPEQYMDVIAGLADLDLDGDGTNEAISMVLNADAVPCEIDLP